MSLVHYIFVRRDLPIGVIAAMITHSAGESAAKFENDNWNYDHGLKPFKGATAIVLEAKDEAHLDWIADYLDQHGIEFIGIYEKDGPYDNQLMSIGVVPREREPELFKEFQTLKSCLVDKGGGNA